LCLGWAQEYTTGDKAEMLETASAVEALVAANRYLDDGINSVILKHFSVREPTTDGPGLDDLFYADYGFPLEADSSETKAIARRSSVALVFQRLLSQVTKTEQKEKLHSLVLYGPAGTGKTTLVEALAQSCGVPMVEVTPSDLAKSGEAALERRARTVFKALSLLTHVVILFDEFDPILRRRDATGEKEFTYFSFLTPGMLPKLKNLSEKASERSVAYVLITNLLGTLDEAAVRRGRFDERVAVFSPDPLSRLGRIAVVAHARARDQALKNFEEKKKKAEAEKRKFDVDDEWRAELNAQYPADFDRRLREVAYKTAGLGMPQLTAKGWYRNSKDATFDDSTPLGYILNTEESSFESNAEFEDRYNCHLRGTGEAAEKEAAQWWWLNEWDSAVKNLDPTAEDDVLQKGPKELGEIVGDRYLSKEEAEAEKKRAPTINPMDGR
jgi:SpoVK/Ycf46/Vps4 family AAA+-type ATPase